MFLFRLKMHETRTNFHLAAVKCLLLWSLDFSKSTQDVISNMLAITCLQGVLFLTTLGWEKNFTTCFEKLENN